MEYIDGKTLAQVKEEMNAQTTEKARLELRRARPPNHQEIGKSLSMNVYLVLLSKCH
jgi:hypothetical protein